MENKYMFWLTGLLSVVLLTALFFGLNKLINTVNLTKPVKVSSFESGDVIKNPLVLYGEASGTWFFEANMPAKITKKDGTLIAQGNVMAEGEWMTTDFVPFYGVIEFTVPEGVTEGYVVIQRDNPSDLPENDDELKIPVRFSE